MKRSFTFLTLLFTFSMALAQKRNLNLTDLTGAQGLSQTHVIYLTQDHKGFIWICTEDGLNKFDGYKETVYKSHPEDATPALSKSGDLLLGTTGGGLNIFNTDTETVKVYRHDPANEKSLGSAVVLVTKEDSHGNLWIGTKKRALEKLGYSPQVVENGLLATEACSHTRYNVILMDVQMPVMDGQEATRFIRKNFEEQPVIVAMTANALAGDKEMCIEAGMDDYISKPIKLEWLIKTLEKWGKHFHSNRLVS